MPRKAVKKTAKKKAVKRTTKTDRKLKTKPKAKTTPKYRKTGRKVPTFPKQSMDSVKVHPVQELPALEERADRYHEDDDKWY